MMEYELELERMGKRFKFCIFEFLSLWFENLYRRILGLDLETAHIYGYGWNALLYTPCTKEFTSLFTKG